VKPTAGLVSAARSSANPHRTTHADPTAASPRAVEIVAVTIGLTAATLVMLWPVVSNATHAIPGELRDPLLNAWILAWDADRIRHGLHGLWEMPMLYPFHLTLAFSEHLLGIAVFTAPLQWIAANPLLPYNIAYLASYVFAGVGMYLLARSLTGRADAAAVAAVVFAFCPERLAQIAHLQMLVTGWMPLALLGVHRYVATGSRTALAGAAAAYWFLAMSNGYFLFFFGVAFVLAAAWAVWTAPPTRRPRVVRDMLVAVGLVAVAYAPIARVYIEARHRYALVRDASDISRFGADVGSYLTMPEAVRAHLGVALPAYPKPAGPEERHDGMLFPGFTMTALAAIAIAHAMGRRHGAGRAATARHVALYGTIAAAGFVLSLGPEPSAWGHVLPIAGPYAWLAAAVPMLDGLRVPARFAVLVYLGLSVLAAFGAAVAIGYRSPRARAIICAALVASTLFETYGEAAVAEVGPRGRMRDDGLYDWLATQPDGAALELPIARFDNSYRGFIYQYNTLIHRHPIVNGWTGYTTELQQFLGSVASPLRERETVGDALDLLRGLGVRYAIVHPDDFDPPAPAPPLLEAMRASRDRWTDVQQFGPAHAFTLAPPDPITPLPPLERIDAASMRVTASHSPDRVPFLFDGNLDTRWTTMTPQQGTEWIEIAFEGPRDVRQIRLELDPRNLRDYPRALQIDALDEGGRVTLFNGTVMMQFGRGLAADPMRAAIDIALPSHPTTAIRIGQTGRVNGIWWWSVDELSLWKLTVDSRQ
jgi:hypothetical protein